MTTEQLERDLRALAEPQDTDEYRRLATRAQLAELLPQPPRRRVLPRLSLGAAAVSLATVAGAIVVLIGAGGSGGPATAEAAIIRHALRAITSPANMIVHVKETGAQDGVAVGVEWWQQTSPPYAKRVIKRRGGEAIEGAADGTTASEYDPDTNTIYQRPDATLPTLIDPISVVRGQLASGHADVAGSASIGGVSLYKITLPNGVIGYFDEHDYAPAYIDNPQRDGTVVRTRVVAYEELPATPANEKLLSLVAQRPGARIDTDPNAAPSKPENPGKPDRSR